MPEIMLWRAVVVQALDDIIANNYWTQRQAISWLLEDSADFYLVCSFAELQPRTVRKAAWKIITNGKMRGKLKRYIMGTH